MRVIHPEDFKSLPKKKKPKPKRLLVAMVCVIVIAGYLLYINNDNSPTVGDVNDNNSTSATTANEADDDSLRTFTGDEFHKLAMSVKYPNTQLFEEPPIITGDKNADARIRKIAESQGYVLTSIPMSPLEKIDEPRLDNDDLLQPLAAIGWRSLRAAADRDGIKLSLISAYRSPEYQRNLFMQRLQAQGATPAQVASGQADAAVEAVLLQAAIPGYSRHHTGFAIDLWCEDGSTAFVLSSCFSWISDDNYKIAKQNGWIPSYPEGVALQGPEPEPWEYVWVSRHLVTN